MSQAVAEAADGNTHAERTQQKKEPPTLLYDNGHGTKVKQWTNDGKYGQYTNLTIERSIPDGNGGFQKHTVRVEERDYEKVGEAIAQAKQNALDLKGTAKDQSQSR